MYKKHTENGCSKITAASVFQRQAQNVENIANHVYNFINFRTQSGQKGGKKRQQKNNVHKRLSLRNL